MKNQKVFVAMSGGVDSSLSAVLLQEAGYEVEGITMLFELAKSAGENAVTDAHRVCEFLKISHHVVDLSADLEKDVVGYFASEYALGRTPNPCIRCNRLIKFDRLFKEARSLGADMLATGHYARIVHDEPSGQFYLCKGMDSKKEQSYFLYGIPKENLPFIRFPLGEMTKEDVRVIAAEKGLPVATRPDSQDICFVPKGRYQDFLMARDENIFQAGDVVDQDGKKVGEHQGIAHHTLGQRGGLRIALGYPAFITKIDAKTRTITLGPRELTHASGLVATDLNLVGMNFSKETIEVDLKIRYNQRNVRGLATILDEDRIEVRFLEPQFSVTPGQSVVFYQDDRVLGGAIIDKAID